MDISNAFLYMFDDPDWLPKLAIGTGLMLAGVVLSPVLIGLLPLMILLGYSLDVTRNVLRGETPVLPAWEDWGGMLQRGARVMGVFLVWALPALVVMLPLSLGSALAGDSDRLGGAFALVVGCCSCGIVLYLLMLSLLSPAITVRLARTGRFSAGFELSRIWALTRDNIGNVILALVLTWVAGLIGAVIGSAGVLAVLIGLLVTVPFSMLWQMLVQAQLFGQVGALDQSTSLTE